MSEPTETIRHEGSFHLKRIVDGAAAGGYVADQRYYLTLDGRAVPEGDPAANTLLVAAGGTLSAAVARRYGLLPDPEDAPDDKAVPAAPRDKAVHQAAATKAGGREPHAP